MKDISFETLVMPSDFYEGLVKLVALVIIVSALVMVVLSVIFRNTDLNISLMWYINIPKILVSALAIVLVFCYNYEKRKLQMPQFDNMLMSTFLVGILAIIEFLSGIAMIIKDVCDKFSSK